jgi:hypothetical protein
VRALIGALAALVPLIPARTAGAHPHAGAAAPLAGVPLLPAIPEWAGGVLAAALLTGLLLAVAREHGRRPRATALAATLLVLAWVAASAPHLVHHALGTDEARDCRLLVSADHADATVPAVDLPPVLQFAHRLAETPRRRSAIGAPPAACERAPPAA